MTRLRTPSLLFLSTFALLATACGGGGAPKVPLSAAPTDSNARDVERAHEVIGPAAQAALDSGNAEFRRKAYGPALVLYRRASELAPQHPAPLFGIYMVAQATKNTMLADSALAGIRARNGPLPATGSGAPHGMTDSALKSLHEQLKKGSKAN